VGRLPCPTEPENFEHWQHQVGRAGSLLTLPVPFCLLLLLLCAQVTSLQVTCT
jgi:hypothetical protein